MTRAARQRRGAGRDSYRAAGRWDREGVRAGDTESTDAALVADEYVERYSLMVDAMRARGMDDVKESM